MPFSLLELIDVGGEPEGRRLRALANLDILDTPPERDFDVVVRNAQRALGCKIVLISLLDDRRQWFKARVGLEAGETPIEHAFCAHTVASGEMMIVPDATLDPRFAANPLVVGPPHIRFYAGVPLRVSGLGPAEEPVAIGSLCAIDDVPRVLAEGDAAELRELAGLVESLLSARAAALSAIRVVEGQREAMHELNLTHRQFRQAERMASVGSWRLTLADKRLKWSAQVYAIVGLPEGDDPVFETAMDFFPPAARRTISNALARAIESGQPFDVEADFVTAQGSARRIRMMGELELRDGLPVALIGTFQDITARHVMEQALRRRADTDELTNLANRARFNQVADQRIAKAKASRTPLALLLIDLDHFKAVNDRCGHAAGDEILQLIASRLQAPYLEDCCAARLGGDEFVLIATSGEAVQNMIGFVQRLLSDLRHSVTSGDCLIHVSATIGVSWLDDGVGTRTELLHRADTCLYEAKRAQRGSAKIFGQNGIVTSGDVKPGTKLRVVT